jgi:hypothetical protein
MADLSKTVAIIFEGDDRVTKTIREIDGKFDQLASGSSIGNVTSSLAKVTDAVLMTDAAWWPLLWWPCYAIANRLNSSRSGWSEKVAGDNAEVMEYCPAAAFKLSFEYGKAPPGY